MGKLINRIPCSHLLISSLPGSALRTHVESRGLLSDSTCFLKAEPGKLDIKRRPPGILYVSDLCQAFDKRFQFKIVYVVIYFSGLTTLVNVYVDLLVFMRIAGTS